MRIAVIGASGNLGSALMRVLADTPEVDSVVGVARRLPAGSAAAAAPAQSWVSVGIGQPGAEQQLSGALSGVDVVVHLAWLLQPSRNVAAQEATNVDGTARMLAAAAAAGVGAVLVASSVGGYSIGPKDRAVDESWPTGGIASSAYSQQKARVERLLDAFEADQPDIRVVRIRPGLVFQGSAGSEIARYFLGPLVPCRYCARVSSRWCRGWSG